MVCLSITNQELPEFSEDAQVLLLRVASRDSSRDWQLVLVDAVRRACLDYMGQFVAPKQPVPQLKRGLPAPASAPSQAKKRGLKRK
jgi:hypothetical protein